MIDPIAGDAVRADRAAAEDGTGCGTDSGAGTGRILDCLALLEQGSEVDDPGEERHEQGGDDGEFDGGRSPFAAGPPETAARRPFG